MLYGNIELQKKVLEDARDFAYKMDVKLIYGAVVGSFSKGMNYTDSDYDTRFLFVRKDFPNNICIPSNMSEEELVFRYYPKEELIYEWIPCWELTSFLQFLVTPSFKNDFSVGLYNIVGWTFQSPYSWDPYGIQNKIMPIIDNIFIKEYEIKYHIKEIERLSNKNDIKLFAKNYIRVLYSALTIDWIIQKNCQSPIYYKTLLSVCSNEIVIATEKIVIEIKKMSQEFVNAKSSYHIHDSRSSIFIERIDVIDKYIEQMYNMGINDIADFDVERLNFENKIKKIEQMYDIINQSLREYEWGGGI